MVLVDLLVVIILLVNFVLFIIFIVILLLLFGLFYMFLLNVSSCLVVVFFVNVELGIFVSSFVLCSVVLFVFSLNFVLLMWNMIWLLVGIGSMYLWFVWLYCLNVLFGKLVVVLLGFDCLDLLLCFFFEIYVDRNCFVV